MDAQVLIAVVARLMLSFCMQVGGLQAQFWDMQAQLRKAPVIATPTAGFPGRPVHTADER